MITGARNCPFFRVLNVTSTSAQVRQNEKMPNLPSASLCERISPFRRTRHRKGVQNALRAKKRHSATESDTAPPFFSGINNFCWRIVFNFGIKYLMYNFN